MYKTAVLICSHNGEEYIEEQIQSILNQTIPVDEIYIHDYNSSDRTIEIVEKFNSNNKKLNIKKLTFAYGPAASFLNSLDFLQNKLDDDFILHITDQDDYWEKNKNQIIIDMFEHAKADATFHDVSICNDKLEILRSSYYEGYYDAKRDISLKTQTYTNCVIGHTISINSTILKNLNLKYHKSIPMHDWYIINQLLVKGHRLQYIDLALSRYRQHEKNILGAQKINYRNIFKHIRNQGFIIRKFIYFQKENGLINKSDPYMDVLKNVQPLKKKIYILTALILSMK